MGFVMESVMVNPGNLLRMSGVGGGVGRGGEGEAV